MPTELKSGAGPRGCADAGRPALDAHKPAPSAQRQEEKAQPAPALSRLMTWLSPAFPVGAYSYSHGLEWAVEAGQVQDAAGLASWIEDLLVHGAGRSDLIFLAATWRAMAAGHTRALTEVAELAAAFAPSA